MYKFSVLDCIIIIYIMQCIIIPITTTILIINHCTDENYKKRFWVKIDCYSIILLSIFFDKLIIYLL